ncbi:MAG: prepilin peptidase [Pasteurellaceae bacterium]|nr:prepilin peptidase [Pasteurellaceae bacterium]
MIFFLAFLISLLLCKISWEDITSRTIRNKWVVFLGILVLPFSLLAYGEIFVLPAVIVLLFGFLLFLINIIGAGDVKLLAVLMLATPTEQIPALLFLISLFGLGLIIVGLLFFRQSIRQHGLPYGVAISLGFIANILLFIN